MVKLTVTLEHEQAMFDLSEVGKAVKPFWLPSDTLPDVRVFAQRVGDFYLIQREISNGSLVIGNANKSKPRIQMPVRDAAEPGWSIADPRNGQNPWDWPMGRASWRRYVMYPGPESDSPMRREAMRLAWGVFRPDWRQRASNCGPCNLPLPRLGDQQRVHLLNQDSASVRAVMNGLNANQPFHVEDWSDGVAFPWSGHMPMGPSDPGEVGGSGIYFFTGWNQNIADLRRAFALAPCEHERMPHWYERTTGEPISTEHYAGQTPDIWGAPFIPPEAQIANPGGDGIPKGYDFAHEIRGTRRTSQVAEQADDAMAKFSLRSVAAYGRLRFSHRGRPAGPGYVPINLNVLMTGANAEPHMGIFGTSCGRQIGWTFFHVAQDIKLNGVIGESREFGEAALAFLDKAVTPTGPLQKAKGNAGGWPLHDFSCQTFEQVILAYGAAGLAIQLQKPIPTFVTRTLESIYGATTQVPILPYGGSFGPPHYIRTANSNAVPVERLKDALTSYGDPAHATAACALMASITDKPAEWVKRGIMYGAVMPTVESKLSWLTGPDAPGLAWDAGWVAQAQRVSA